MPSLVLQTAAGDSVGLLFLVQVLIVGFGIWYFGQLEGVQGQTLGKKAMNIRVIDQDTGLPIGFGRGVGRYFARILSAIPCGLGYFWMLWDGEKQTWHDKIVRSYVVVA